MAERSGNSSPKVWHGKPSQNALKRASGTGKGVSTPGRAKEDYPRTPIGPFHTEEQKRKLKEALCFGVHPRMYGREHTPSKASFPVRVVRKEEPAASKQRPPTLAEKIIEQVPTNGTPYAKRLYWERAVFDAYLHLFGETWDGWARVVPWLKRGEIAARAASYQSVGQWDWIAKREFVDENGLEWSLSDLNNLISWYTVYQVDEEEQQIYVGDWPFDEIVRVARLLGLPCQSDLDRLARSALEL